MPDRLQDGFVRVTHPDVEGDETADVTVESFVELWRDKGYEVVEGDVPKSDQPSTPKTTSASRSTTERKTDGGNS
jgi:hypothetical protein